MTMNTILSLEEIKKEASVMTRAINRPCVIEQADDVLRLLGSADKGTQQVQACHLPLISAVKLQGGFENAMAKLRFGGKAKKVQARL